MNKLNLGNSTLQVSEVCLGAMTFGKETSEADSFAIMNHFAESGGNFIDTANAYSKGVSETIVGSWLGDRKRDDFIIATKMYWPMTDAPDAKGSNKKQINRELDNSLERMKTDYVDLYYMHFWDSVTPLEETYSTLNDLVTQGKIRHLGVSNYTAYQFQKAVDLCRGNNWAEPIAFQPCYNLMERTIELELLPMLLHENIASVPWSPLQGGWLSGKYRRGMEPPQNTRVADTPRLAWEKYANEHTWQIIDALIEIAEDLNKTPAQVALRWICDRPGTQIPILGVRTMKHLKDNLGAIGWSLDEGQMSKLNEVSKIEIGYPYHFMIDLGPEEYRKIHG